MAMLIAFQFSAMVAQNDRGISSQQELLNSKMVSRIVIESFAYNTIEDQIIAFVRNTGEKTLDPETIDVYLNGDRITKDEDFSAVVTGDTDSINAGLWDKTEILRIVINRTIAGSAEHQFLVTEVHGVYDVVKIQPTDTDASY